MAIDRSLDTPVLFARRYLATQNVTPSVAREHIIGLAGYADRLKEKLDEERVYCAEWEKQFSVLCNRYDELIVGISVCSYFARLGGFIVCKDVGTLGGGMTRVEHAYVAGWNSCREQMLQA